MRWHCPPDTGFEIRALAVWGRARYFSITKYWIFRSERGRNILFLWNLNARVGFEPAITDFPSKQLKPLHHVVLTLGQRCKLCRAGVSTAAFHARARGSVPGLGGLKETKNVSSPSTCESQYCGEPPWPRGSVLSLRPPGLDFRILCLEDSVISIISPSSGGSPGPV